VAKFEDNLSPYLTVVEQGSTPANPSAGDQKLFVRTSDHVLCYVNSSGVVTPVSAGLSSPLTTTGDMIYSSSGTTAARLAVGGSNTLLHGGASIPAYSAVLPADFDFAADNTTANASTGHHGLLPKLGGGTTNFLRADGSWNAPAGGGGAASAPTIVQSAYAGTTATTITLAQAPANGHTLILAGNTQSSDFATVSSTNTTWTKIYSHLADSAYRAIWVGLVAGGAGGTTITVTFTGSYNSMTVIEITDTLTATAGNTAQGAVNTWVSVSAAAGHIVASTGGNSNTTSTSMLLCTNVSVGRPTQVVPLLVAYSGGGDVGFYNGIVNGQDLVVAEIT
jgi:hypothetical protein